MKLLPARSSNSGRRIEQSGPERRAERLRAARRPASHRIGRLGGRQRVLEGHLERDAQSVVALLAVARVNPAMQDYCSVGNRCVFCLQQRLYLQRCRNDTQLHDTKMAATHQPWRVQGCVRA